MGRTKKTHFNAFKLHCTSTAYLDTRSLQSALHTQTRERTHKKWDTLGETPALNGFASHTEHTEEEQTKKCCGDGKEGDGNDSHRRVEFPNTKLNAFPPTRATAHRWHFPQSRGDYRGLCAVKPYLIESSL